MKQTVVGWLAIEYNRIDNKWKNVGQGQKHCAIEKAEALKQAKAMEKEQMKNACIQHQYENKAFQKLLEKQFEQYYNETYEQS